MIEESRKLYCRIISDCWWSKITFDNQIIQGLGTHMLTMSPPNHGRFNGGQVPYLPVYKSIPCISRPPIFDGKKRNFLISLLNVHGTLILYSLISGNVDTQKNQGLKRLIVLLFSSCCICGHFVLEFRKSSQKIEHVNLKLTCFVVQG